MRGICPKAEQEAEQKAKGKSVGNERQEVEILQWLVYTRLAETSEREHQAIQSRDKILQQPLPSARKAEKKSESEG